jgi:hypothetical protein
MHPSGQVTLAEQVPSSALHEQFSKVAATGGEEEQ